ncbi:hypothetical protein KHQ82_08880 [Mycoplasmatota bacterium]|nr:hypothetical protein KHQ82_08880 [Mycoplasmatota bacterium]
MNKDVILKDLEKNEIAPVEAYDKLFDLRKLIHSKSSFVKVSINISNEPLPNKILKVITFIPFPIFLVKMFSGVIIRAINKHKEFIISKQDFNLLLDSSKGLVIDIESKDTKVLIKVV